MQHVLTFLEKVAEGDWDIDFTIEQWQTKENEDAIKEIMKPTTKTSTKIKDPNRPKRGLSAYMLFCADQRPGVKAELVDAKPTEVTAELGRRWNTFKESTKPRDKRRYQKYADAAAVDKQRYDDEMADYVAPSDAELELITANKPKRGRKTTDEDAKPKRGKSSYLYFCAANREAVKYSYPEMAAKDVTAELGRLWRELKVDDEREDEYEKYQRLAAADKERYEAEMAALEPTEAPKAPKAKKQKTKAPSDDDSSDDEPVKEEPTEAPKAPKAKKKTKAPSDDDISDDEPVKEEPIKKRNAYHRFCDDHHSRVTEENPEMTKAEVRKQLTAMWKELSKEEKEVYKQ
jgi:hypothetical protein